jgi:hypothetical protein
MHTQFRSENLKERKHLGDPGVDERITLKIDLRKIGGEGMNGLNWLMITCNNPDPSADEVYPSGAHNSGYGELHPRGTRATQCPGV